MGATLFSVYNYINHQADSQHISRNTQSISKCQKDHLKHIEVEVATTCYLYLQSLNFNSACQDLPFQGNTITDKFLSTLQQFQFQGLSSNFLKDPELSKFQQATHT
jgi:hypothetical protein